MHSSKWLQLHTIRFRQAGCARDRGGKHWSRSMPSVADPDSSQQAERANFVTVPCIEARTGLRRE